MLWIVKNNGYCEQIIELRKNSSFNWFTPVHVLIRPDVIWNKLSRPLYHVHFTVIHNNSRHTVRKRFHIVAAHEYVVTFACGWIITSSWPFSCYMHSHMSSFDVPVFPWPGLNVCYYWASSCQHHSYGDNVNQLFVHVLLSHIKQYVTGNVMNGRL